MKRCVHVLMSTYNGGRFLVDQIESILNQQKVDVILKVRDDGSFDDTWEILFSLSKRHPQLHVQRGMNIGIVPSFMELLTNCQLEAQYIAFSDQDDVWESEKLFRAVSLLETFDPNIPVMYCSTTKLVDENLNILGLWPSIPLKGIGFRNALIENIAVGCTILINQAARKLIVSKLPNYKKLVMHDWWIYLCVSAFGRVIFDKVPYVLYRQHANNSMGGNRRFFDKISKRYKAFRTNSNIFHIRAQAEEFFRLYGNEIPEDYRQTIKRFLNSNKSIFSRFRYAFTSDLYRQNMIDNILFRLLYAMNKA